MVTYANKPTPTGRTSLFAISRPSADHVWRTAEPIIEKLHCFGKIIEAAPKHLYTKGAGDRDHVGRANSGLTAEIELNGEVGFSGLNSLLFAFFGDPNRTRSTPSGDAWLERFEMPLSPLVVFTLCEYDGVGRFVEVPSVMLTSFSLEAKADGFFTWHMKGHGDRVIQNEACFNSPVDVLNASYASGSYADKYVAHNASEDSTLNSTFYGRTRLRKSASPVLMGSNFAPGDELPWSAFKLTIDLKANAIGTQRRSKGFPAINDIPEAKFEITVPTEGDSVDTTHNWADLIDDAFSEGGNDDTPKFPIFNKLWMELCGPDIGSGQPYLIRILCPRLSTRCTNPTAASSGLEPIKAELMALRNIAATPLQIPGNSPIYFFYQTDHDVPAVPVQEDAPVITGPVAFTDTQVDGTTPGPAIDGTIISLYVDGLEFATGLVAGGLGAWSITGLDLSTFATKTLTAKAGFGESKSLASAGEVVV